MILTAGPGIGKSVLFAKICEMYKQYGQLAACHFCDFKKSDYSNPHIILESLAAQMCDNVDGYREKLNEVSNRKHSRELLSDAFRVLLEDPLCGLNRFEPMLIIIDALDESKTEVKGEFLELIADEFKKLPKWIKILISSRPELQVRKKLEFLKPLEILPDDENHLEDLKHFIKSSLPNVSNDDLLSLISKCEGSFLYAYYLVNELKQGGQGFEPITKDYISKGIAGFYHKQFTRLKTGLQRCKPNAWSSILKCFRNVIAASKEPLPRKILFTCMGLSGEEFEVREMMIGIMSEILPIYDNCLTVYHKSLWDWLTLNGYEEHAFVADIKDGKYRLWRFCENVYHDILSLRSIADFQISPETNYALKFGDEFLLDVGSGEDFHWLVNVRLIFLKMEMGVIPKFRSILKFYQSKQSNYHFWVNIHIRNFSPIYMNLRRLLQGYNFPTTRDWSYIYLQSLANGYFDFIQKAISGKNEARDILDEKNEVWVEEIGNDYIPENKIISHAIVGDNTLMLFDALAVSPDNRSIGHKERKRVQVLGLPNLTMVFSLEVKDSQKESQFLQFSPDSLYLVWNSARSCISLTSQMEVPLIPHGPVNVDCVSFSPCGMRLVTCEKKFIKLWNVKSKDLLAKVTIDFDIVYSIFNDCNLYIFSFIAPQFEESVDCSQIFDTNYVAIYNSTTLERLNYEEISCPHHCLIKEDDYQIMPPPPPPLHVDWRFVTADAYPRIGHFHSPTGRVVVLSNKYCSNPFEWKNKKCVIFLISDISLVFYDFINKEVLDKFHIDFLPTHSSLRCVSKLDETNFLVAFGDNQAFVLSLEASTESCERESRFVCASDIKCYALSPDDSYIACCSEDLILTIINVNNGKNLQTVELKHRPEACWWSEFYLWVICNGVVVKFPYNLAQTKVLGNEIEERSINFESVVVFMKGVLVIRSSDDTEVYILKICDNKLVSQQIPDSNFTASSASVSSDGCAVLLYDKCRSFCTLWEITGEHRWKLRSSKYLETKGTGARCFLSGTKDFRTFLQISFSMSTSVRLASFDLRRDTFHRTLERYFELPLQSKMHQVFFVNSSILIIINGFGIHFVRADGDLITSLCMGMLSICDDLVASFFVASRSLLLLGGKRSVKIFRIRNIEKFLPD